MDVNVTGSENATVYQWESTCTTVTEADVDLIKTVSLWLEGVFQCTVAVVGIGINLGSSFILTKKEMRNSFNLLLVMLAVYDTCYLVGAILESIRKFFHCLMTDIHKVLFPHFLYPMHQTAITGSIFMTVAIAFERYTAVHFPINFNQTMNNRSAMKRRLATYLIPVCGISCAFNVPKFFESYVKYTPRERGNTGERELFPEVVISQLKHNSIYTMYNSWSRVTVLGVLPLALLVFFNVKIYRDIRKRQNKRRTLLCGAKSSPQMGGHTGNEVIEMENFNGEPKQEPAAGAKLEINGDERGNLNADKPECTSKGRSLKKTTCSVKKARRERENSQSDPSSKDNAKDAVEYDALVVSNDVEPSRSRQTLELATCSAKPGTKCDAAEPAARPRLGNAGQRKTEDHLAVIFMAIIFTFLICHFPRVLLDIHDLITLEQTTRCNLDNKPHYSLWSVLIVNVSHFLLVVNSSVNMVVYCLLGSKFRMEVLKTVTKLTSCFKAR